MGQNRSVVRCGVFLHGATLHVSTGTMPKTPSTAPSSDAARSALCRRLSQALADTPWADEPLSPLPDTGLAHDHIRLGGSGWLARVPKQSQLDLPAQANLQYQQACFERASASGHAPRLHSVLPPQDGLPRGALLVECIQGRPARLPQDLPALARALAALHTLPLPELADRPPLMAPADPLADLAAEIARQALHLAAAALAPATLQAIQTELLVLEALVARPERPPVTLVAFDAHPGNFLIRPDGQAVLVDLEKCRYSHPSLDLAHATLYTSTTWDLHSHAVLTPAQEAAFLSTWAHQVRQHAAQDTVQLADACAAWHVPLRRAMWLWSVTWCAKWRATSDRAPVNDGEDWSQQHSDPALVAHVRERVHHYLDPATVHQVREGFDALQRAWGLSREPGA